ncbi:DUF3109 family protein [Chloroherpeton thalassium]|nr:DUF3109 family protein [Chloroherpeton thalassium]
MARVEPITILNVQGVLVEKEVLREQFKCDLACCKGICCVEGELGAPVQSAEIDDIERNIENILRYLPEKNVSVIQKKGFYEAYKGDLYLQTVAGKECVFALKNAQGIVTCGIEAAFYEGQSDFLKPISCHLFPIRVKKKFGMDCLVYEYIPECNEARTVGQRIGLPVYAFIKPALIRKYGEAWYHDFEEVCHQFSEQ